MNAMNTADILQKHKNKLVNAAAIVFALIVANNIYGIYAKKIEALQVQKENEIRKNEVLSAISQSEKKVNSYKQLINAKDLNAVLNTISNLARDFSVSIISVRPRGEVDYSAYTRYGYEMTVIAKDYHSLGKFISKLESSPDIFMVYSLVMQPADKQDDQSQKEQPGNEERRKRLKAELVVNTVWVNNLQK